MAMFGILKALLPSLTLRRAGRGKLLRLLSVGPTASADGEASALIGDLLAVEAEIALDAITSSESCKDDLCYPRGARLIMPEGFWPTRDVVYLRLDEAYDAIVVHWSDPDTQRLGAAFYSMLRIGGVLVIRCGDAVAEPLAWLRPWFADLKQQAHSVFSGVRRNPEPFRLGARVSIVSDGGGSSLNCTAAGFQRLCRRHGAALEFAARAVGRTAAAVEQRPVDIRQVQLQVTLALGDAIRALEGDVVAAVAKCELPLMPRFESALGLAFQATSRFWTEHRKASFYLWVGKDGHTSRPDEEADRAISVPRAKKLLRDLGILVDFSRGPLVAVAGLDPGFSGLAKAVAAVPDDSGAASPGEGGGGAPADMGDLWNPASSAGEYPDSSLIYRSVFGAQQVDYGLLKALLSRMLVPGDSIADFGASLGAYSIFLNRTGLVEAFAFDGSPGIDAVTKGAVRTLLLDQPFTLWQSFDWALCLEVLEHIPQHSSRTVLENLRRHARKGAVISWALSYTNYLDPLHVNGRDDPDVLEALREVGFERDAEATDMLRAASTLWWVGESVAVYRAI